MCQNKIIVDFFSVFSVLKAYGLVLFKRVWGVGGRMFVVQKFRKALL